MSLWRTVRVFLSSTFRDMHAERDQLVKVVFPRLRERLLPYRVELIDIDLRWGITAEQAENDQVLSLCLEQIDECQLFFTFLGHRYGWVPGRIPDETRRRFPWVERHPVTSATELEILHGALNHAAGSRQALFCLRDPRCLAEVPGQLRTPVFEEGDEERRQKLTDLKSRLRASGYPTTDYGCSWDPDAWDRPTQSSGRLTGLEEFGRGVEEWLYQAVVERLHLSPSPPAGVDPLEEEADLHERFLEARRRLYIGQTELQQRLAEYAAGDSETVGVVTGPSGSGKSASLAEFVHRCRQRHSGTWVLPHFAGASPRSTALRDLLGRLCHELKRRFGFGLEVPESAADRARVWLSFLAEVPAGQRVVVVLDALNQLEPADGAHTLFWLPRQLPPHVKVLVSCLDEAGPAALRQALAEQPAQRLPVKPLDDEERRTVIRTVPKLAAKSLDDAQVRLLLDNPATANPLYLLVALEELRVFGSYEGLDERIAGLPTGPDALTALFGQVFERLEDEFSPAVVRSLLTLLASARHGLTEAELRELMASDPGAAELFAVLRQLRPYLLNRAGRLDFYHANVAPAVRQRYLTRPIDRREAHSRLARYFAARPLDERQVEELPWQYAEARDWNRLAELLAELPFFAAAEQRDEFEVRELWSRVEAESPLRLVEAYRQVVANPGEYDAEHLGGLARLLYHTGHLDEARLLWEHLIEHYRGKDERNYAANLGNQALILKNQGDLDGAMTLHKQEEEICRRLNDPAGLQRSLGNQALILKNQGDLDGAMTLHKQEEEICRRLNDPAGLGACLGNQALILRRQGDLDGAMTLHKQKEEICRRLNDPAGLYRSLGNQALILQDQGDLDGAMTLLKQGEEICRRLNDPNGLQTCLGNQAGILKARGDLDGAMTLHKQEEEICRRLNDPAGLQTCLGNQAGILKARGDLDGAMTLLKQKEEICRRLNDPAGLQRSLGNQAGILKARGDLDGAMTLHKQVEEICRRLNDPAGLYRSLGNQALILKARGDLDGAVTLHKQEEEICRRLNDPAGLGACLGNQALILKARGDLDGAMTLHKQEEEIWRRLNDPAGLQRSLGNQALILKAQGDLDGAMSLHKQQEESCRRLNNPAGLAISLANQASLLAFNFSQPLEALPLAEEALRLASQHGLLALARQIQPILDEIRRRASKQS